MAKFNPIIASSFGLAKGTELLSDDAFEFRTFGSLSVAVLCDGVGSALEGRTAAFHIVNSLIINFKSRPKSWSIEKSLRNFIANINSVLYQESMQQYGSIEHLATLCIVVIEGKRLYGANVGDSRIYLLRENRLSQLSIDHNDDEMRHVLTKAIGLEADVDPYMFENNVNQGDKILLCSDGVYTILDEESIKQKMQLGATALVKAVDTKSNSILDDDASAIIISVNLPDEISSLKALALPIPKKISAGDVIDGYHFIKSLIQNNRTWLCEKEGKRFVLKFPPLEAIDDEQFLDLFIKEAWNASRLKAGFFVKAWIPKKRSMRYYVLDYAQGLTLQDYLGKKPLHIDDAINLGKFLLNMSQFLLTYDMVHGDIKPENIIVSKRENKLVFKMIDYGSIVELFSIASRAGTPSYLAPERFKGASINEQSELFAIGVTLYKSLTLKYPYGEIEPFQNPKFNKPKKPKHYNNNIPNWLESILLRAISVEQNERYEVYSQMKFELENSHKVKPYFTKGTPLLERAPLTFYKVGFIILLISNIITVLYFK